MKLVVCMLCVLLACQCPSLAQEYKPGDRVYVKIFKEYGTVIEGGFQGSAGFQPNVQLDSAALTHPDDPTFGHIIERTYVQLAGAGAPPRPGTQAATPTGQQGTNYTAKPGSIALSGQGFQVGDRVYLPFLKKYGTVAQTGGASGTIKIWLDGLPQRPEFGSWYDPQVAGMQKISLPPPVSEQSPPPTRDGSIPPMAPAYSAGSPPDQTSLRQTLAEVEAKYGANSLPAASAAKDLGNAYADAGRYQDSEHLLNRALSIEENKLGNAPQVVASSKELGVVYQAQGKYADAERMMAKSLAVCEKVYGPENPKVAASLSSLGAVYINQEKLDFAEPLLTRASKIYQAALGSGNPRLAEVLRTQAQLRHKQKRFGEAESLYQAAIAIWKSTIGTNHPQYRDANRELANTLISAQKPEQAATVMKQVLDIDEHVTGNKSAVAASDLMMLSQIYQKQGKKQEELDAEAKANEIKKTLPGMPLVPSDPRTAPSIAGQVEQKWALVVGISNFKDPTINLRYAAKDATDFSNYLVKSGHFQPDHVKLLVDEQATRQNIVDSLGDQWLASKAGKKDLLVVYVSSHGGKPIHDAGVNFLVPYEGSFRNLLSAGIPMEWLSQIIQDQLPCQRVVLILDVCHSGAAVATQLATSNQNGPPPPELNTAVSGGDKDLTYRKFNFDASKISAGSGQFILCSSQVNQRSWESQNYQNSVFTHWLIEGLKDKGNTTTLGDAYKFMKMRVEDEVLHDRGEQQTPIVRKSWQGEELVLGAP